MDADVKKAEELAGRVKELEADLEKQKLATASAPVVGNRSDSHEMKTMRSFGCTNMKQLLSTNVCDPKFKHIPEELKHEVIQLKQTVDSARAIAVMYYGGKPDRVGRNEGEDKIQNLKKELEASPFGREVMLPMTKAYTTGANADWINEITASSYLAEFELQRKVTGLFKDVPMQSNPYHHPTQDGTTEARIIDENATMTSATFPTGQLTFDSTKLGQFAVVPEEMTEDSAPAILPVVRDDVVQAQERAYEQAIINGNAADTVAIPADSARLAWDGLRKLATDNSANGGTYDFSGTLDDAGLKAMKKQGGKYTVNPMALAWIASPSAYHQMVGLEVFSTAEKFGDRLFTNLTGVLGAALGIPVIISEYLLENMTPAGIEDGVTETHTGLLLVNRQRFFVGTRRPIKVRVVADLPQNDRWLMSSYSRKDFQGRVQSASETSVIYGVNIAS